MVNRESLADALADFYGRLEVAERGGVTVLAEFINPVHQDLLVRYLLSLEDAQLRATEVSFATRNGCSTRARTFACNVARAA